MSARMSGSGFIIQATGVPIKEEQKMYAEIRNTFPMAKCQATRGTLREETTHLIVGDRNRQTQKLLTALAKGSVWLLPIDYFRKSISKRELQDERNFDMGLFKESGTNPDLFIPQPRKRGLGNEMFRRPFTAWNVAIVTKDRLLRERYTKILMSGGADVKAYPLLTMESQSDLILAALTHVFVDSVEMEAINNLYEKNQRLIEARGPEAASKILSLGFIEETLTSASAPDTKAFNPKIWKKAAELYKKQQGQQKVHDSNLLGSPNINLDPKFVRGCLDLKPRTRLPSVSSSVLSSFSESSASMMALSPVPDVNLDSYIRPLPEVATPSHLENPPVSTLDEMLIESIIRTPGAKNQPKFTNEDQIDIARFDTNRIKEATEFVKARQDNVARENKIQKAREKSPLRLQEVVDKALGIPSSSSITTKTGGPFGSNAADDDDDEVIILEDTNPRPKGSSDLDNIAMKAIHFNTGNMLPNNNNSSSRKRKREVAQIRPELGGNDRKSKTKKKKSQEEEEIIVLD